METKESLIEKIDFCETVLKTMIELEDNIKKLKEKELELQKEHKDIVDEGPWDRGTLIFYCVFVGLLCAGVGLIATVIIGLFTASWKSFIIYGAAALGVMAMIWRQKDAIEKSKFEIPTKLAENERKLEENNIDVLNLYDFSKVIDSVNSQIDSINFDYENNENKSIILLNKKEKNEKAITNKLLNDFKNQSLRKMPI